jgi:hypothetical protein
MPVAPDVVINGTLGAERVDYFKFAGVKGQRVIASCETGEIDSRMQEVMILTDASGRELARNRRGGAVDVTPDADGDLVLELHDVTYRNGDGYFYRLTISTAPHIDFVLPPSGIAGANGSFTLYGRNLPGSSKAEGQYVDGSPLEQLRASIDLPKLDTNERGTFAGFALSPASAALDAIPYRFGTLEKTSNPALVCLASDPVILERETNNKPAQAQSITVPCELVGQFFPENDRDWAVFDAKKGDVYWIEVFSHRLGLPTDPAVLVQRVTRNDKGEEQASDVLELNDSEANVGGPEFNTVSRDPAGRFEVKEEGTYRVSIRDLFNRSGNNPRRVYRLSIHRESPDFRLVALPLAPPPVNKDAKEAPVWSPLLRRGETIPIRVVAFRRDGFKGDIQLSADGLPAGVSFATSQIDGDKSSALLFLTAGSNTNGWFGPIRVTGKAKIGDHEVVREALAGSVTWTVPDYNNEAIRSRLTSQLFLAVSEVEPAPISIQAAESKAFEVATGGKIQIPLKIDRHGDFNESMKLKAKGSAAFDALKELDVDGKTNVAMLEIDLAQVKLTPGTHTFELQTQTKGKYRNNPEAADQAEQAAKDAAKAASDLTAEVKKAAEVLAAAEKTAEEAKAHITSVSESDKAAAEAALKAATEAKDSAAKTAESSKSAAKEADEKKARLEKRAKELKDKAAPKEVTITVYSAPITIQVKEEEKKPAASGEAGGPKS